MKAVLLFYALCVVAVFLITREASATDQPPQPQVIEVESTVQGKTAAEWHRIAARYRRQLLHRWRPTVEYALELASHVYGISEWELRRVSYCESTHYPFARNGRYLGLFQLGWRPFGLSPFDPVANALSAAATVRRDGSWRQWQCKP